MQLSRDFKTIKDASNRNQLNRLFYFWTIKSPIPKPLFKMKSFQASVGSFNPEKSQGGKRHCTLNWFPKYCRNFYSLAWTFWILSLHIDWFVQTSSSQTFPLIISIYRKCNNIMIGWCSSIYRRLSYPCGGRSTGCLSGNMKYFTY